MGVAPKRDKLHFSDLQYASHTYATINGDITICY